MTGIEHYKKLLEEGAIFDNATFYLHDEESVKDLRTAFENEYAIRILSHNEVPFWATDLIGVRVNRLEKGTVSVGGMRQ